MSYLGIARNTGEFDFMQLDEDEYVGEEVSALYDQSFNVIMLQRNRNSLSPSGIEKYFSFLLGNGDQIELKPIPVPDELKTVKPQQIFRKLSVGFSPTNIDDEILNNTNNGIIKIIRGAKEMGALRATVILSLGNSSKEKTLSQKEIVELGSLDNPIGFNRIQVNRRENEDTEIEMVDLISSKLNDVITMTVSKKDPIKYERLILEMQELYNEKVDLLNRLFGEE